MPSFDQRFGSTPSFVSRDAARRDQTTALVGLRFNVFVDGVLLRPGVAYAHPLDAPMSALGYRVVNLDFAVAF